MVCPECQKEFAPTKAHRVTCSDICKKARKNRLNRLWMEQHPDRYQELQRFTCLVRKHRRLTSKTK